MTNVDENGGEQSLILKSQSPTSASSGDIEVLYDAADNVVRVMTNAESQGRVQRGEDIPATFIDGDQFIARARADGMVEVYRNEQLLATRDVTAWSYYAEGGYTGLSFVNAGDAVLDDFGGGTVSTNSTPTPTSTSTPTPTETSTPTLTFTPTETSTPTPTFTPTVVPLTVSSVVRNGASPTNASSVGFTVTFSEPVTGVDASDFALTTTDLTGASIAGLTGSGTTYTVSVNTGSGNGIIRLDVVDNDTIVNGASSPLAGGFTQGQVYTVTKIDDAYSVSLLHMNGTDGATTFKDETGKVWTVAGNAQVDTAQSVFGGASGLFDGTGDYLYTPDSADWRLDGGSDASQWTIDMRVKFNGDPGTALKGLMQQYASTSNYWTVFLSGNKLYFIVHSAGSNVVEISNDWDPASDTWYHIAVVKNGTAGYLMFVDGVQIGLAQTDTTVLPDFAGTLRLGNVVGNTGTNYYLNGWLDEVRVSKGIARWTTDFIPQTTEYGAN
jgi:hypothetical protein